MTYICPAAGNREKTAICTETGYWKPNSSSICEEAVNPSGIIIIIIHVAKHNFFLLGFTNVVYHNN